MRRALRAVEAAEAAEKKRGRDVERAKKALEKQSREQEEALGKERATLKAQLAEQARGLAGATPSRSPCRIRRHVLVPQSSVR